MQMQEQQEGNWCWAAVAVSIYDLLHPRTGTWTQGKLATPVLDLEGRIPAGVDCNSTPALCNLTAALDDALKTTGDLRSGGYLPNQHLVFESIKAWVKAGLPIGVRIVWQSGGAHFIALDGYTEYASGAQVVSVQDPLYGPSLQDYQALVSDYPPGGSWQDTYLVKKAGGAPAPPGGGS